MSREIDQCVACLFIFIALFLFLSFSLKHSILLLRNMKLIHVSFKLFHAKNVERQQ